MTLAILGLCVACTKEAGSAPRATARAAATAGESILKASVPPDGAVVRGSVQELILQFKPAARLDEVTIDGPSGMTPMMITSAGDAERYSLPFSASDPGTYTVNWRATAAAREYRGSLSFNIR